MLILCVCFLPAPVGLHRPDMPEYRLLPERDNPLIFHRESYLRTEGLKLIRQDNADCELSAYHDRYQDSG